MNKTITLLFLTLIGLSTQAQSTQELLDFDFEGIKLSGVLNLPKGINPKGIVLIVHGDGKTNAVAGEWYYHVRNAIVKAGYATYMWDKMGCGNSGGTYKNSRPVAQEALEVIAVINNLRENKIKGSDKIGLWGISRAGWINPIVINQYKNIAFWISVSGVDNRENFGYLLEQNLRINGHPKDYVDQIVGEWIEGIRITHSGGSYEAYQKVTPHLGKNDFWLRFTNGGITEAGYYSYQQAFMQEEVDKETGLQLYIANFESILSNIDIPVLALFGELDMNVDWKKTRSLYEQTLATNTDITIKSFPNCNHNMWQCTTGGIYELQDDTKDYVRCDGFLDSITNWLNELE